MLSMAQQPGIYIPKKGKVFFANDTSTMFSNVVNQGKLGIGKNAVVHFKGKSWENDEDSRIIDETDTINGAGVGGQLHLDSEVERQIISGGFNTASRQGAVFSQIYVNNKFGVELGNSSIKVANEIALLRGVVFLRDQVFVVGHNNPGTISGYDSSRYFVTGNKIGTGLLLREKISSSDGQVIFPVGSRQHAYTPAAIVVRTGTADDFYVSVHDSVRSWLNSGALLSTNSVNKTWEVGKLINSYDNDIDLSLQHLNENEGPAFALNRSTAFISKFDTTGWDLSNMQALPLRGYMTTGPSLLNSGVNTRSFRITSSSAQYFSKFTSSVTAKTDLIFYGHRMDYQRNMLNWITHPEVNISRFIVQRRLYNETEFTSVDTVASKAVNGVSTVPLYYDVIDPNNYTGISFYRLQIITRSNDTTYSNTIAIAGSPGKVNALIWPNPTPDKFYIGLTTTMQMKSVIIYNALGQKVREELIGRRTLIQMGGLRPGTYTVAIVSSIGELVAAQRLIVIGR